VSHASRSLTVAEIAPGAYEIRWGKGSVSTVLVQPNYLTRFGLTPTDAEVRAAMRETGLGHRVTDQTPVVWTTDTREEHLHG